MDTRAAHDRATAITPSDADDIAALGGIPFARSLYIGTAGALKVDTIYGDTVTFGNVGVGSLNLAVKKVYATGTAASNIVGFY